MNKKEFNKLLTDYLDRDDPYEGNDKQELTSYFFKVKNDFVNANENERMEINESVLNIQNQLEKDYMYKSNIAEKLLDETDFDVNNPVFQASVDLFNGDLEKYMDDKGNFKYSYNKQANDPVMNYFGYESVVPKNFEKDFDLEFMNEEISKIEYNREAQGKLEAFNDNTMGEASNLQPGDNVKYPYKQKYSWIFNNITNKYENFFSLANHALVGEKSFKENMAELLTRGSYESLGITRAEANIEDPTRFTPITPVDAKVIAENYIKEGSDSFKKDLTHYYAKYDMQQWDAYIPNNVMTGTPNQMDPNEFA